MVAAAPAEFLLEVDAGEHLPVAIAHHEKLWMLVERALRPKAAPGGMKQYAKQSGSVSTGPFIRDDLFAPRDEAQASPHPARSGPGCSHIGNAPSANATGRSGLTCFGLRTS